MFEKKVTLFCIISILVLWNNIYPDWVPKITKVTKFLLFRTKKYSPLCGPTSSSCGRLWPLSEGFFYPLGKKKCNPKIPQIKIQKKIEEKKIEDRNLKINKNPKTSKNCQKWSNNPKLWKNPKKWQTNPQFFLKKLKNP